MIQCNRCNLQYIGETKRRLKDRFIEHRRTIDNRELKQRTFLRSRTPTGSRWSNHVHTAHVMTFVWSRRRRQNATFQVEGRTPQNML